MLRSILSALSLPVLLLITACSQDPGVQLRDGDILFQDFPSAQSAAIKLATGSEYTHVGIVFLQNDTPYVWEAVQPVTITALPQWIGRHADSHYVVTRIQGADTILTQAVIDSMKAIGRSHMGKEYDLYFEWNDDRLYCSELVWKLYHEAAGVDLAAPRTLGDYDLSHPLVQAKMKERWGENFPADEPVVAPSDLFHSQLLDTVMVHGQLNAGDAAGQAAH